MFQHRLTKRFLLVGLFLAVFVAIVVLLYPQTYKSEVVLGGKTFLVDVADTNYLLSKGLSGREPLGSDEGMFFVFQKPDIHTFWMKDMNFPIDIIWMDENFDVIHIEKSISPETYPKTFTSKENSMYVLEISAGESQKLGIKIGDEVKFLNKTFK